MGRQGCVNAGRMFLLVQLFTLLAACGGDDEGDPPWNGFVSGPNEGKGWVSIYEPQGEPPNGLISTFVSDITLEGHSFISPGAACPALSGDLGPGYKVTWSNSANGTSGAAEAGLNCILVVIAWWRIDYGVIHLEIGDNPITITASDALGNVGRASLMVSRSLRNP